MRRVVLAFHPSLSRPCRHVPPPAVSWGRPYLILSKGGGRVKFISRSCSLAGLRNWFGSLGCCIVLCPCCEAWWRRVAMDMVDGVRCNKAKQVWVIAWR